MRWRSCHIHCCSGCYQRPLQNNGIQADVVQMRVIEIANNLNGVDLVVTTMRIKPDFDVPYVNGMAFLTGINKEATEEKSFPILKTNPFFTANT